MQLIKEQTISKIDFTTEFAKWYKKKVKKTEWDFPHQSDSKDPRDPTLKFNANSYF